MKSSNNSKQIIYGLMVGFLVVTGTYNAVVINSESSISGADVKFAKRLDEVYGVIQSKREVAASMNWQKLSIKQAAIHRQKNPYQAQKLDSSSEESVPTVVSEAAVKEDLNLSLTQVINPKKWQQGLNPSQYSGNLTTNNGVIESLSVSLPNSEGISVSFSEMTGNVFEYDFNGELYSGMMYQEGQNSYVVSLTNGPLEGTRLTFTGEATLEDQLQQEEHQRTLAENSDAEAGVQAEQAPEVEQPQEVAQESVSEPIPDAQQEIAPPTVYEYQNAAVEDSSLMDQQFQEQAAQAL